MSERGGRSVVRALEDEGVPYTFGIPGTHNIELYDVLGESDAVEPVLVTNEQSASFMADGLWRATGRLGCVNLVPGAGLTHALSGIAEAYLDNVPMLVLSCGVRSDTEKAYQLHDVDQMGIAAPVTKARIRPERGEELYRAVRHACRLARSGAPGPVMVEVPAQLYLHSHSGRDEEPADLPPIPEPALDAEDVARAADVLREAGRPLLYVGQGAAGAGEDLVALAEALEAPVATTFQGKGVFPESHPLWMWPGFGDAAPPHAREIAGECDATLAIGCRFSEVGTGSYGLEPPEPLVHVDIDPAVPGRNFPARVAVTADARELVPALLDRLDRRSPDDDLRERIERGLAEVREQWLDSEGESDRVSPLRLLEALQSRYGSEAAYVTDSGNGTFLALEGLRLDRPRRFLAPVDYSCMGYSVPAAVGAALGRPGEPTVALVGDGAFLMTGLELLTAAARELPLLALVLRDGELAQIAQFQEMALDRKVASRLPDYDVGGICRACGAAHLELSSDGEIEGVLDEAGAVLSDGRPAVVEVAVDYSYRTYLTRGAVKTSFRRLPWKERLRMIGRAAVRKVTG